VSGFVPEAQAFGAGDCLASDEIHQQQYTDIRTFTSKYLYNNRSLMNLEDSPRRGAKKIGDPNMVVSPRRTGSSTSILQLSRLCVSQLAAVRGLGTRLLRSKVGRGN
jgi:hypothetical protein